jgi:hypothetical protein
MNDWVISDKLVSHQFELCVEEQKELHDFVVLLIQMKNLAGVVKLA